MTSTPVDESPQSGTTDDTPDTFDVVVIGGGPVGEVAAQYAVEGGLTACLIEAELFGGECSYWACVPSKALLRPLELRAQAVAMTGVNVGPIDVAGVLARRDSFTGGRDDTGQVQWAAGANITTVRGRARLAGPRVVEVDTPSGGRQITARHAVVVATGTGAAVPDVPGLRAARPWTSRDATNVTRVPRRVVVLGGGVVACEASTWLRGLGAEEVTILERGDRLLARLEPFASAAVLDGFTDRGVTVRLGVTVESVARPLVGADPAVGELHGGEVVVTYSDDQGSHTVVADEILVAAGREPRTAELGLDSVGITADDLPHGYLQVDESLAVTATDTGGAPWLYAVGDVNGRVLLTHMGKYQARVCAEAIVRRITGRGSGHGEPRRATADHEQVPQVTFTAPQVASVGLTEAEAQAAGRRTQVVELDIAVAGSSLYVDGFSGHAKLVFDLGAPGADSSEINPTDELADAVIIGATFVGTEVAELLHAATIAVVGRVPVHLLWHAVPSFPTVSEVWLRLLERLRA